ncbi:hypothetical protein [Streptomyces sp. NPDC058622]|uniref:hypothetical protein n=1 Tax=Streptomyces sp. NPDC058622 TaxID=3346562 RepID=UPI0036651327
MDTPDNGSCWSWKVWIHVARPSTYSAEFRSDAIALCRASASRRTFRDVAALAEVRKVGNQLERVHDVLHGMVLADTDFGSSG